MKVLVDINHPAHVHYFRNFAVKMTAMGHDVLFVSRNKEMEHALLNLYGMNYISRGRGQSGKLGKMMYLLYANYKLYRISRKFQPDVYLNFLHPYPSQVAFLYGKTSLVFSDTEHARLHHQLTVPFATKVFTPSCYRIDLGEKHIRFNSYMELAYLHPNYFTPNPSVLDILGVEEGEKYVIMRFVSWKAAHDFNHTGMSLANKRKAVKEISRFARVFISSEKPLPDDLEPYRIQIPFDKMHDAIHYSSLLFGESATMASEAAVLGTPSIFMDNDGRGYTDEEGSKYGLVYTFTESETDQQEAINRATAILSSPESSHTYKEARERLLNDCIDTTAFIMQQVLKYDPVQQPVTV